MVGIRSRISCMRTIEFDSGHRVAGHESKCARLHGHRYKVELHARTKASVHGGRAQDDLGRVVDFSVLKERVGGWVDATWDHRTLIWKEDPFLQVFDLNAAATITGGKFADSVAEVPFNPTAENIAKHLVDVVCPAVLEGTDVEVYFVVVWETPNCNASATKGGGGR